MKIRNIFVAAGLVVASLGVSAAADARPQQDARGYHDQGRHRGWDRGDQRGWNRNGNRGGNRHAYNQPRRCWMEWHHNHRVRVCR